MHDLLIEATFVGAEDVMGYRRGKRYMLRVSTETVVDVNGLAQPCPYSVQGFLTNWTDIDVHHEVPRL